MRGGSTPPGAITRVGAKRKPYGWAGRACQLRPDLAAAAYPSAYPESLPYRINHGRWGRMPQYLVHRTRWTVHRVDCASLNEKFTARTKIGRRGKDRAVADRSNYDLVEAPEPPKGKRCSYCAP